MRRFYERRRFHDAVDGLFPPSPEIVAARQADDALQAHSNAEQAAGVTHETDEFLRLNAVATDTVATVPRGQRWRVDWRI